MLLALITIIVLFGKFFRIRRQLKAQRFENTILKELLEKKSEYDGLFFYQDDSIEECIEI